MSFFGQLLAGAVGGAAGGYLQDRQDEERMSEKLELRRLQQEQALQLQAQRQQDRIDMFNLSQAGKTGSGSGGSKSEEFNPVQAFERAYYEFGSNDPRTQRAYELVGAYSREGQGSLDGIMGRARAQGGGYGEGAPTSADVLAAEAYTGAPQPPENATRGQREALLGQQALMRFRAGVVNNGSNVDDFAKAEGQFFANDVQANVFTRALKAGKSEVEAAELAARAADPATYDKNRTNQQRVDASLENTKARTEGSASNVVVREDAATLRALEARKAQYLKQMGDPALDDGLKVTLQAEIDDINRRLKASGPQAAAPAPQKAIISNDGKVATGKIGSVQSVIEKYRQQQQPR